jgi:hypothetical protein
VGGFIGGTREEQVCVNVPKLRLVWVSGWRKKWREFKRNGGLEQLKLQAKGLIPPTAEPEIDIYQNYSCQDLSDEFGIIAGRTFGTADADAIKSFNKRNCKTKPQEQVNESEIVDGVSDETETEEETDSIGKPKIKPKRKPKTKKPTNVSAKKVSSDKIAGIPNEVIIGLAVAFVLVGGFLLINRK